MLELLGCEEEALREGDVISGVVVDFVLQGEYPPRDGQWPE